jgi:endonuclease YncB( thermonuclease family)
VHVVTRQGSDRAAALVIASLLAALVPLLVGDSAAAADRDCSDFQTQGQAQHFFESHNPGADPHNLDADNDGKACEHLPAGGGGAGNGGGGGGKPDDGGFTETKATLVEVTDGDTVTVRTRGTEHSVRLIGIDTPEVFFTPECGGTEASAALRAELVPGESLVLTRDPGTPNNDLYGRLLRYVEDRDQVLNLTQIESGWAKVYQPKGQNFADQRMYRNYQSEAKQEKLGVWGKCGGDFDRPVS